MVPLTEPQAHALAAIRDAWPDDDVVLIGALALGHHIPMDHRTTDDLDLAVAVTMEGFPGPLASLLGWTRDPKMEHRYQSDRGQVVDVLPAGKALITAGYIEWPGGVQMSLVGFDLAFAHNTTEPAGETTVLVPTAPVLAFLKMRAWLDRPEMRKKDLGDLAHLLCEYLGEADDRRWADDLVDLGLDFEDASPYALGRDLGLVMAEAHRSHVTEFLAIASPEKFAAEGPVKWGAAELAERALKQFERGLDA